MSKVRSSPKSTLHTLLYLGWVAMLPILGGDSALGSESSVARAESLKPVRVSFNLLLDAGIDVESTERKNVTILLSVLGQSMGEKTSESERSISTPVPGQFEVEIPSGTWLVEIDSETLWLADRAIQVGGSDRVFSFMLRPAGQIEAKLIPPRGEEPPETIEMLVARSGVRGTADPARSECPVRNGSIRCKVPAQRIDLKLSAEGRVPRYFWDLEIEPEETLSLGAIPLRNGGSLAGWVLEPASGEARPDEPSILVELGPEVYGFSSHPTARERVAVMKTTAEVEDNGFFQLSGLAAGTYRLKIDSPSYSLVELHPIQIEVGEELEIEPIELSPRSTARFQVEPPKDPFHEPWHVSLLQLYSEQQGAYQGKVDEDGSWTAPKLDQGTYLLKIRDSRGSRWSMEEIDRPE